MVESAVLGVFCAELMVCVFTGVPIVAALVAGLALFIGYGLWRGCRLRELACMCARGVASARGVLESFVLIGALTALWRACGTVSEVVVLAAPLVRPAVAPLAVFCMCSLMSFLIGTSSGTAATMGVSIALAALVCAAARRMSAGQIASVCVLGFTPADPTVAELMSGGGVVSMVNVSLVVCLSSSFSGLFDGTGLLDGVRGLVEGLVRRVSPYAAVLAVSVPASMVACNQTLGIMLTSQLCGHAEARARDLAIDIEDAAVVVAPLVPWSIACGAVVSMCGAPAACWCAAFYLWLIPIWRLATEAAGTRFGFDGGEGARSAEAAENSSRAHA